MQGNQTRGKSSTPITLKYFYIGPEPGPKENCCVPPALFFLLKTALTTPSLFMKKDFNTNVPSLHFQRQLALQSTFHFSQLTQTRLSGTAWIFHSLWHLPDQISSSPCPLKGNFK